MEEPRLTTLHYQLLGEQAIGNYAAAAELKLQTLNLNGTKTKNWNFERYLVEHKEQHMILEKLKDYGHAGISELSKVSYFKRGITDPALEHVKGSLACQKGTTTFDDVVTAYRTYKQSFTSDKGTTRSINVSAISASTGNRTSDRENKIGEKEDGYDQSKDYSNYHVKRARSGETRGGPNKVNALNITPEFLLNHESPAIRQGALKGIIDSLGSKSKLTRTDVRSVAKGIAPNNY